MPYTDRQLRCLSAMGLVAWQRRAERVKQIPPVPHTPPMPREPAALARWLPTAPLGVFHYREQSLTRVGKRDAPLLVLVERAEGVSIDPPLSGAAGALFENMLRAIGRRRHDTCQCTLVGAPEGRGDNVASLAGREHRVALVLVRELDAGASADACRLPEALPVAAAWCLPHPDLLLAEPGRKRQAWEILNDVRARLASVGFA